MNFLFDANLYTTGNTKVLFGNLQTQNINNYDKLVSNIDYKVNLLDSALDTSNINQLKILSNNFTLSNITVGNILSVTDMTCSNLTTNSMIVSNLYSPNMTVVETYVSYSEGTVTTPLQPCITSLGTLDYLQVSNDITSSNLIVSGNIYVGNKLMIQGNIYDGNADVIDTDAFRVTNTNKLVPALYINHSKITSSNIVELYSGQQVALSIGANTNINIPTLVQSSLSITESISGNLTSSYQPNITTIGTLSNLIVSGDLESISKNLTAGNINATFLSGSLMTSSHPSVTQLGNLDNLSVKGIMQVKTNILCTNLSSNTLVGTLLTPTQPNITSIGELQDLNVSGTTTANYISGILTTPTQTSITSLGILSNLVVSDTITANYITGILSTSAQPNITSLGTLSNLNVSDTITTNAIVGTLTTSAQPNITSIGTLSNLSVSNTVTTQYLSGTLTTSSQPNITSLGTLSNLNVSGNLSTTNLIINTSITSSELTVFKNNISNLQSNTSYLSVSNNTTSVNSDLWLVGDLILQGNIYNTLSEVVFSDAIKITNSGSLPTLYVKQTDTTSSNITELYSNSTSVLTVGNSVTINLPTYISSNLSVTNGISGTLTTSSQPNITSIGTLPNLTVSGTLSTNYTTGTLTTSSQPNVTSLGTLSSLSVSGNLQTSGLGFSSSNPSVSGVYCLFKNTTLNLSTSQTAVTFTHNLNKGTNYLGYATVNSTTSSQYLTVYGGISNIQSNSCTVTISSSTSGSQVVNLTLMLIYYNTTTNVSISVTSLTPTSSYSPLLNYPLTSKLIQSVAASEYLTLVQNTQFGALLSSTPKVSVQSNATSVSNPGSYFTIASSTVLTSNTSSYDYITISDPNNSVNGVPNYMYVAEKYGNITSEFPNAGKVNKT